MLVWDLGGVVANFRPERRLEALSRNSGMDPAEVHQRIWGSGLDDAAERGALVDDALTAAVLAALDHRINRDELRAAWALAFEPRKDILRFVADSPSPAALMTNNGTIVEEALQHELSWIGNTFETLLLSCRLGHQKPSAEAFARASAMLKLSPSRLVLIDDTVANTVAAEAAGWRAILFTDLRTVIDALPKLA